MKIMIDDDDDNLFNKVSRLFAWTHHCTNWGDCKSNGYCCGLLKNSDQRPDKLNPRMMWNPGIHRGPFLLKGELCHHCTNPESTKALSAESRELTSSNYINYMKSSPGINPRSYWESALTPGQPFFSLDCQKLLCSPESMKCWVTLPLNSFDSPSSISVQTKTSPPSLTSPASLGECIDINVREVQHVPWKQIELVLVCKRSNVGIDGVDLSDSFVSKVGSAKKLLFSFDLQYITQIESGGHIQNVWCECESQGINIEGEKSWRLN